MNSCAKHTGAFATGLCGECGHGFCEECLVFPFGPSKPAMCIACALAFSGVRGRRERPPAKVRLSRAERKQLKNRPTVPSVTVADPLDDCLPDYERWERLERETLRAS
jgi:hypothetical protein